MKIHQPEPSSLSTLDLNAIVSAKNVEVIQEEILGHGDVYLCTMFLTVHDKLTCEVSSTWSQYFVYIGPKHKR